MMVASAVVDAHLSDKGFFYEGPPVASPTFFLRSATFALASTLIVVGARRLVSGLGRVPRLISEPSDRSFAMATGVGAAITAGTVLLVVFSPKTLNELVLEDQPVEYLSALFCFLASALVVLAAIRSFRSDNRPGRLGLAVALLALGALFALVGFEEVSWFQRLLDTETGDLFAQNAQGEINLHNFATDESENVYYGGAFLLLTMAPFVFGGSMLPPRISRFEMLIPSKIVLYGLVYAAVLSYEMWNGITMQSVVWMSVVVMFYEGLEPMRRPIAGLALVVMIAAQTTLLLDGDSMVRSFDDTEVREMVISLGFLIYALELVRRSGRLSASRRWPATPHSREQADSPSPR